MAKPKAQFRRPSANEQLVLDHFQLRLLTEPAELARCDALIVDQHYLHSATLVGEHLRYAATYKGEWLAVVSFSAAAYHLRYRDQFIGWSPGAPPPPAAGGQSFALSYSGRSALSNLASRLLKQVLALVRRLARALGHRWRWSRPSSIGVLSRHHL